MCIFIKKKNKLNKLRIVGRLSAKVLEFIEPYIKIGMSTGEIDYLCYKYITKNLNVKSASLGYNGFPKSVCISVNEVVCHGIPNYDHILKNGDILNIDVAILKDGVYGDTSKMFFVGNPSKITQTLCKIARDSLYLAILIIKPGIKIKEIGKKIQNFVESKKFSVVREYCGHGIGSSFHEYPQILHFYSDENNISLQDGMVFTIEPMINLGSNKINLMKDGWTVKTKDNKISAQYEHTIVVNKNGCEILTLRKDDILPFIITNKNIKVIF
ncbi:MAG: type I methionyl aminopeptidase [Candidatus Makana argininalis]